MSFVADTKVILKLLRGMPRKGNMATRLEAFYGTQAEAYDLFRERLLQGRRELMADLSLPANAVVVELGGGTGRNIDYLNGRLHALQRYEIVDLCPSLLAVARQRAKQYPKVVIMEADACTYQPNQKVDCVIFSYSLTMIPDWRKALQNAQAMLKPDGQLLVVDFTISGRQSKILSAFWQRWFAHDGVHLNLAHRSVLQTVFPQGRLRVHTAKVPYLPFIRVPYYLFYSV